MAIYILNRVPSKALLETSFKLWNGRKPSLRLLFIWVCPTNARIHKSHEKRLDPRTISRYFIGYLDKIKRY